MVIDKPWSNQSYSGYYHQWLAGSSGTVPDHWDDTRDVLRRTPRGVWRPPTPYWRTVESDAHTVSLTADVKQYAWYGVNEGRYAGANQCSGYWYDSIPAFPDSLESRAIMSARLKLKNESVSISQNLGEVSQTADLVVTTCKRLANAVEAVRHLDPSAAARALGLNGRSMRNLKTPFELWLEMQYGWKPMLQDCHDAVKQISDQVEGGRKPTQTVISTQKSNDVTFRGVYADNVPCCNVLITKRREIEHKCKVRLDYELANPLIQTATQLGLTNPAELAWELLPFSFVADWFIPIGDYISQLDADFGWTFKGGTCSRKTTIRNKVHKSEVIPDSSGFSVDGYAYASGGGYQMAFNRSVYGSSPYPDWRALAIKTRSNGQHVANGISLLTNAFVDWQIGVQGRKT